MKKNTCFAVLASAASALTNSALTQAEDKVSVQHLNYQENKQRMSVSDVVVSAEHNPNVDHQLKLNVGIDALSGASPAWQPRVVAEAVDENLQQAAASSIYGYDPAGYDVKRVEIAEEERRSIGASWLSRDKKRNELTMGIDYSEEPDYVSRSASSNYMWFADRHKNRSYSVGASIQKNSSLAFDEFYNTHWEELTATNIQVGVSQVMSYRTVVDANIFTIYDTGYLSNHYQTILRLYDGDNDGVMETYLAAEHRPDTRKGFGFAGKWLTQWNSNVSSHFGWRWYSDDWGVRSQTLTAKSYLSFIKNWTFHVLGRFYNQSEADFYKDPDSSAPAFSITGYGSSDHRLGTFHATTTELGVAYEWQALTVNLQAGSYKQSEGFGANWVSSGLTFKY